MKQVAIDHMNEALYVNPGISSRGLAADLEKLYGVPFESARSAVRRAKDSLGLNKKPTEANGSEIVVRDTFTVDSPQVRFEARKLTVLKEATTEDIQRAVMFVTQVSDYSLFWWGDLLNEIEDRKTVEVTQAKRNAGKDLNDERQQKDIQRQVEEYVRGVAESSDNPERILEAAKVCAVLGEERHGLSYEYHREAVAETGKDRKQAQYFLALAEKNGWPISVMRQAIRLRQSEIIEEKARKSAVTIAADIRRLQTSMSKLRTVKPVENWSHAEVNAALDDLEPVMAIHSEIFARWKHLNPDIPGLIE